MKIQWLGHSAFLITTRNGARVLMDPYESGAYGGGIGYGPIQVEADLVTISHDQHEDHNCLKTVGGNPSVIKGKEGGIVRGIVVRRVQTYHDNSGGRERGENQVTCLEADGMSVCHLGDLGHLLTPEQVAGIGSPDVLLVPVGGIFTVDPREATQVVAQLQPRLVIPMHYKTSKCGFPIAAVDEFLEGKPAVEKTGTSTLEVQAGSLGEGTRIVVLEHAL